MRGMQKDVRVLIILVLALSFVNLLSVQIFLNAPDRAVTSERGGNFVEGKMIAGTANREILGTNKENTETESYVSEEFIKYEHDNGIPTDEEDDSQDLPQSQQTVQTNEQQNNEEQENELQVVPPSEDGPPAETVEGKDLTFDFGWGVG